MNRFAPFMLLGVGALALSACGDADNASTEAMPDTVEMPADEALEPIEAQPVEDSGASGPPPAEPIDPQDTAPDPVTTNEAADAAAQVAADAAAAAEAAGAAAETEVEEED